MQSQAEIWAKTQFDLGVAYLADQFSKDYTDNLKRSLAAFTAATTVYSPENHPQEWARCMLELGSVYLLIRGGDKSGNLQSAIQSYNDALRVYEPETHPFEWAECHRGLGKAFLGLSHALPSFNKQALLHYEMALRIVTKDNWPELWHVIHLELALLYSKSAEDPASAERLAKMHYRLALSLDKVKYATLYNSIMRLHELYSDLYRIQRQLKEESDG